jgi:hypothetical protein
MEVADYKNGFFGINGCWRSGDLVELVEVELTLARLAWVEKIAYTALTAGVIGILSAVTNIMIK